MLTQRVPAGSGFSGVSGLGDFSNGEISKVGSANPTLQTQTPDFISNRFLDLEENKKK